MLLPCRFHTSCLQARLSRSWLDQRKVETFPKVGVNPGRDPKAEFLEAARKLVPVLKNMIVWIKRSPTNAPLQRNSERYSWAPVSSVHSDGRIEVRLPLTKDGTLVETVHRGDVIASGSDDFAMTELSNAKGTLDLTVRLLSSPTFLRVCREGNAHAIFLQHCHVQPTTTIRL